MGAPIELTGSRWKDLLSEIREELGEGKIRGLWHHRRLEVTSPLGTAALGLGGWANEDTYEFNCVCVFFEARRRIPLEVRVTAGQIESNRTALSMAVRRSLACLAELDPRIHLAVHGRDATLMLPGIAHDRSRIIAFLLQSMDCLGHLVKAR
jgi:hypothetical protein